MRLTILLFSFLVSAAPPSDPERALQGAIERVGRMTPSELNEVLTARPNWLQEEFPDLFSRERLPPIRIRLQVQNLQGVLAWAKGQALETKVPISKLEGHGFRFAADHEVTSADVADFKEFYGRRAFYFSDFKDALRAWGSEHPTTVRLYDGLKNADPAWLSSRESEHAKRNAYLDRLVQSSELDPEFDRDPLGVIERTARANKDSKLPWVNEYLDGCRLEVADVLADPEFVALGGKVKDILAFTARGRPATMALRIAIAPKLRTALSAANGPLTKAEWGHLLPYLLRPEAALETFSVPNRMAPLVAVMIDLERPTGPFLNELRTHYPELAKGLRGVPAYLDRQDSLERFRRVATDTVDVSVEVDARLRELSEIRKWGRATYEKVKAAVIRACNAMLGRTPPQAN